MKLHLIRSSFSAASLLALALCLPALAQAATLNLPAKCATRQAAVSATTTTLTSSFNSSVSGWSVTFAATVSPPPGAGDPTGTVTFTVDGTAQAPVPLGHYGSTAVMAFYTTSTLAVGSHTLLASYSGDGSDGPSISAVLTEVVNPHENPQYVSPSGNDINPGTQASPKLTIQAAINSTLSGDSVVVEDGTYTGPGDVDLDFGGKNITVTSQNGASATIIDCGGNGNTNANHRGFYLHSGETSAVISGFTIQNGYEYGEGGGILNSNVSVTVQNCVLRNNIAVYGGGICNSVEGGEAIAVVNCLITGNSADTYGQGGGIANSCSGGTINVLNCTITGNVGMTGTSGVAPGSGIYNSSYPQNNGIALVNNILYGDVDGELGGTGATISYCDIQGGYAGTGNIDADPLFVNSLADLHLKAGSPCLGAGTASGAPTTTIDGVTRPNPPSIGAYEQEPLAVTTLTSSLNPSVSGRSVTFTASVSPPPGAVSPTGTVTFAVDGTAQAPLPIHQYGTGTGMAFYTTSSLTVGSHTFTAAYSGDSNYGSSMSAVLTEVVNAHVNPQYVSLSGNDSNPGTQAAPKLTIQAALNSVLSRDLVLIGPGTYTGPGNVDLSLGGQNILVLGMNGPTNTIIDCQGSRSANHRGFSLGSETNTFIAGLTIENGYEGTGGGIINFSTGLNIQNCIIKNNTATDGGGLYSDMPDNGIAQLTNCVIEGNTASEYFGGGVNTINGMFTMTNCTVINNTAVGGLGGGICVSNDGSSTVTLTNDIFYGDTGGELSNGSSNFLPGVTSYCDIQGNYTGTGNIDADPLFVNSLADLHLGTGSPCLGAGTASGAPTTTIDGVTRPDPPSIGAYEGVPVATTVSVANVAGTAGQSVTLSATLTATSGGGLGGRTLSFTVDGVAAGTAVTNGMGTAGLTYAIQAGANTGSHTINVSFAGDSVGNPSSGTGTLTVSAPVPVGQVRYWPRTTYPARMVGGLFQGSSDNAHWTMLAVVTQTPPVNQYSTLTTSTDPATFRYLRYLAPNGSYGNVAEIEFDSHGTKLTGTGFGTAGSYSNSGNTFAKALDGNTGTFFDAPAPGNGDFVGIDRGALTYTKLTGTAFGTAGSYKNDGNTFLNVFDGSLSTFFDAPAASGDYAGIDLGAGQTATVTRIGYCPRPGYASRMVAGVFQGSNDNAAWTALYTVTTPPATGALTQTTAISSGTSYRYLRYLAPSGSYGNVAEVEFDTSP